MTARKRKKHGGARAGAGRPPSGKERRFELKMPVTVYAAFAAAAARAGKPLGTWLIAAGEVALAREGSTR